MRHDLTTNLLTSDCDVIVHQVNCKGVMGAGIAKDIRAMYPQVYIDYMEAYRAGQLKLGNIICSEVGNGKLVYSLCGQYTYGRTGKHTDEKAVGDCFVKLHADLERRGYLNKKIGIPRYMGCSLGGGDWNLVSKLIDALALYLDVYVCRKDRSV